MGRHNSGNKTTMGEGMKKSVLTLAVLGAFAATGPAVANTATVSGFADIVYTITDDAAQEAADNNTDGNGSPNGLNDTEGKFGASGEVNFVATPTDGVTVRVDVDLELDGGDSGNIEQAFFAWSATESVTVLGGVFNNPIGAEAEDAPDMWGTNHGVVWNILDHQTALDGDNIAGLAGAFGLGPVTLTLAYLNEIQHVDEENSVAVVINATPIEGLDLELGHVTQEESAENVTNFNVSYSGIENLSLGLDYLAADEIIDAAYELSGKYTLPMGLGFGLRFEAVEWADDLDDSERMTFHVSYQVASNLTAILEVADGDHDDAAVALASEVSGIAEDNLTTLEFIATF